MDEEEKKAIEDMNRFANGIDMSCVTARQMQIILNLVEKLQKENKELKRLMAHKNGYTKLLEDDLFENCSNYVISKQKVKDKIEELKNVSNAEELEDIMNRENYTIIELVQYVLKELLNGNDTNVGSIGSED